MDTQTAQPLPFRILGATLLTAAALALGACGGGGPARYDLSGDVTYQGRPVPGGRLFFEPDPEQANQGPGSVAEIHDGFYRTRPGRGHVGGPHVVTIFGTDGTVATEDHDNSLFRPYRTTVELPMQDAAMNFDVPDVGTP